MIRNFKIVTWMSEHVYVYVCASMRVSARASARASKQIGTKHVGKHKIKKHCLKKFMDMICH